MLSLSVRNLFIRLLGWMKWYQAPYLGLVSRRRSNCPTVRSFEGSPVADRRYNYKHLASSSSGIASILATPHPIAATARYHSGVRSEPRTTKLCSGGVLLLAFKRPAASRFCMKWSSLVRQEVELKYLRARGCLHGSYLCPMPETVFLLHLQYA